MSDSPNENTTLMVPDSRGSSSSLPGASLVVIHGQQLGVRLDVYDQPVVIGRAPQCDFQIEHRSVSRKHCKIWQENGNFVIRDLGSTNHTYVNERAIKEENLHDGDSIVVGETVFKFVLRGSVEARYHEAIYMLATMDSLTQLHNRRKFRELLDSAVDNAKEQQRALSLAFLDLDFFKKINDEFGHIAGDDVLRTVTRELRRSFLANEIGGRLGGEEFAVMLVGTEFQEALERAEVFRKTVEAADCLINGAIKHVTVSVGVSTWHSGMLDGAELMREADSQLLRAKSAGRNRVCALGLCDDPTA